MEEPIVRMCVAYNKELNSQPEDCRDQSKAMLAAVKVIWDDLADENMGEAADWMRDNVVRIHESEDPAETES